MDFKNLQKPNFVKWEIFENSSMSSLGSCEVPQKIWAVQPFWRFVTQTDKHHDRQAKNIHIDYRSTLDTNI